MIDPSSCRNVQLFTDYLAVVPEDATLKKKLPIARSLNITKLPR